MISKVVASEMEGAQTKGSLGVVGLSIKLIIDDRRMTWKGEPERVKAP